MPNLADTCAPRPDGQLPDVNLRTESRKYTYAAGDEPLPDYIIQRGVGVGGFGEVYYATSRAGKDVALKRIQRNLDVEIRGVQQCLNLRHPNLVELYDIRHDAKDAPWVLMEFIGGDSLRQVVQRNPEGLSESVIEHWFKGIAAGVAYLHDNDVVHRDLKPGNIFLDNGIVKIGDYGLAKLISASRRSGQTESVGTFHYMAPEIGRGKYGRRIDIYAMGILLYEMATGRVPFDGESSQEIIMKHLTAEPEMDRVPPQYRAVISRAMAKDPDRRYSTVDAMLADLNVDPSYYQQPALPILTISPDGPAGLPALAEVVTAEAIPEPPANSLDDEPIARGLHDLLDSLRQNWQAANFNTPTKFVLLLIAVLLFVLNASWLVPTAGFMGTIYAGYLCIWMLLAPSSKSRDVQTAPLSVASGDSSAENVQRALRENYKYGRVGISRQIFSNRTTLDRAQELVGSMLLSTLVVGVLSFFLLVVGTNGEGTSIYSWAPTLAWMALTSVAGTWIVLAHGKAFEARVGDPVLRRFSMLVAGMGLGAFAHGLASWLVIAPTYLLGTQTLFRTTPIMYSASGNPTLFAAMTYFGSLMLILRWWKQADPLREGRLSIFTTIACVATAILIHFVLPFPRGFLIAATISMATQISAPWLSRQQRQQLVEAGAPLTTEV